MSYYIHQLNRHNVLELFHVRGKPTAPIHPQLLYIVKAIAADGRQRK